MSDVDSDVTIRLLEEAQRRRVLIIDIDGTICTKVPVGEYDKADPLPGAVEAMNHLREAGFRIFFYSSRHFIHWDVTTKWLRDNGFEYEGLILNKPLGMYYIDDKAIRFGGDWKEILDFIAS